MLRFQVLQKGASAATSGSRLGRLCISSRNDVLTPSYVAVTSRGVIPHLSQDTLRDKSDVKGVYLALEDCKPMTQQCKPYSVARYKRPWMRS